MAPDSLRISPGAFWATFRDPAHGRLLLYLIWVQMGVHVSAPYFTPFMLGPLKLSYGEYAVLTGIAFVARIAAMPALGSLAHRAGSQRLLWIASLGIVPLPALWLIIAALRLAAGGAGRGRASRGARSSWRRCWSSSTTSRTASAPACSRCSTWRTRWRW